MSQNRLLYQISTAEMGSSIIPNKKLIALVFGVELVLFQ